MQNKPQEQEFKFKIPLVPNLSPETVQKIFQESLAAAQKMAVESAAVKGKSNSSAVAVTTSQPCNQNSSLPTSAISPLIYDSSPYNYAEMQRPNMLSPSSVPSGIITNPQTPLSTTISAATVSSIFATNQPSDNFGITFAPVFGFCEYLHSDKYYAPRDRRDLETWGNFVRLIKEEFEKIGLNCANDMFQIIGNSRIEISLKYINEFLKRKGLNPVNYPSNAILPITINDYKSTCIQMMNKFYSDLRAATEERNPGSNSKENIAGDNVLNSRYRPY